MIKYKGLFVDSYGTRLLIEKQNGKGLEREISNMHITFEYFHQGFKGKDLFPNNLMAKTFQVQVVGFGRDSQSTGFEAVLPTNLQKYYRGTKVVHITTSLSADGKAVNTANLNFEAIKPFYIMARLGYFGSVVGVIFNNLSDLVDRNSLLK